MGKLFSKENERDNEGFQLSMESIISAELSRDELIASHDEIIQQSELLDDAYVAVENLELSLMKDKEGGRDAKMSLEEYLDVCDFVGYEQSGLSLEDIDNISLEGIVIQKKGLLGEIGAIIKKLGYSMAEGYKALTAMPKLLSQYNSAKLEDIKDKVLSGVLVPNTNIDSKKMNRFNNKLSIFHAFGYSANKTSKDLITYLNFNVENITKNKFYENIISTVHKSLIVISEGKDIPKDKMTSKLFGNLKNVKWKIDPKSDDFKFGIIMDMFSSSLSMVSIAKHTACKNMTNRDVCAIAFASDVIKLNNNRVEEITALDQKELMKLIEYGINAESDIAKAVSMTKTQIFKTMGNQVVDNLISLLNVVIPYTGVGLMVLYKIRVARFANNLIKHLLILNKQMINYDKFIIEYVNLTYKKA